MANKKITLKQLAFVEAYLGEARMNATRAYKLAGYSCATDQVAGVEGHRLLKNPKVEAAIAERRRQMAENTDITPEKVLKLWMERATVDVNEIVEYRRDNCRHCWGVDHQYQWTESEYQRAQHEAAESGDQPPDAIGGFGYNATREPNPSCPECAGEGRGKVHVHDTRRLKGAARQMYRGVHQGKDGLKALVGNPDEALKEVGRILGVYTSDDEKARLRQQMKMERERHELEMELKRLEAEKLRIAIGGGEDDVPTPVRIVVEVKDARMRDDAEPEPTTS
ncbi:terminase small subunit [Chromobacterium haemolyticum]|uniref:Terminase small subunit n=1 Tax=Chromobacterium haemolyticum TaxID=394935 RepID=A0A1W0D5U9_9NEIS|nr:terminase small subunit [Chromobacterium haemolyticum]OQS42328.1 hypothetical protein B0T45_05940 [Chromobacterium haemolyticum]